MSILSKVRVHVDEASYLYGLANGLREKATVSGFLARKKLTQVGAWIGRRSHLTRDVSIEMYGARHVVDLMGSEIYVLDELYRERLYDQLADFVPGTASTVVDVGANVGMFAVRQARRGAQVYAFEPNPDCYRRLSRTVVENGLTDEISALNYAVGTGTGTATLSVPNNQTALGSLTIVDATTTTASAIVRMTSLDQILPALGVEHVDLLKIDTEGAEVDVLRGAQRMLDCTDRIILEYHSDELREEVGTLFCRHGFEQVLHVDTPAPYLPDAGMIYAQRAAA
jgi:FkbM family methyltransferase